MHFHDDDIYDAGWEVDFALTIPATLQSGLYAAHLRSGDEEDYIPFVRLPDSFDPRAAFIFAGIGFVK